MVTVLLFIDCFLSLLSFRSVESAHIYHSELSLSYAENCPALVSYKGKLQRMRTEKRLWVAQVLLLVLGLLPIAARAQKSRPPSLPTPPGTIQISDNLFIDKTEVANLHWLEYLHQIKRDSTAAFYQSQLPDSTARIVLVTKPNTNPPEVYAQPYLLWPGYRFYPLVDLTYEQAVAYCKWRSTLVNRDFFQSKDFLRKHPELRDFSIEVEYRLPTEAEWQQAASATLPGQSSDSPISFYTKSKLQPIFLTKAALTSCLTELRLSKTEKVYQLPYNLQENYYLVEGGKAFFCADNSAEFELHAVQTHPAKLDLCSLVGNVAEMTATRGIAKGGSFKTSVQDLTLASRQTYQGPQNWLGFRCVATVRLVPKTR